MFKNLGNSELVRVLNYCADMVLLSLLWALCSLPIITIGVASAALYHTAVKVLIEDKGTVVASFVQSIRDSWRQALPIGAVLSVVYALLLYLAYTILLAGLSEMRLVFTACVIVLLHLSLVQIHLYPLIGHFTLSRRELLSLVIRLTSSNLLRNAALLALFVAGVVIAVFYPPLLAIILPAGFTWLAIKLQSPMFARFIKTEPERGIEDGTSSSDIGP